MITLEKALVAKTLLLLKSSISVIVCLYSLYKMYYSSSNTKTLVRVTLETSHFT